MTTIKHFPCAAWNYDAKEIEEAKKNHMLLNCDIELTRKCNLRCLFCYSASGTGLNNELTLSQILQIIDEANALGAKTITLTGGEPTIHPHFWEIVEYIRTKNMIVGKCSRCNEKSKCYGCRAIAYAMTGDIAESDPLCWH